jgi:hypothetical protein
VRLSRANASTLYALVQEQGVLNTTVTLTGSAAIALARHPNNAVARRAPAPAETVDDQDQYASASGGPMQLTPQARLYPGQQVQPQQRPDDGYIYPADGSSDQQLYPAPRGSRAYDAQAYQQQQQQAYQQQQQAYQQRQQRQYYDNQGYAPPPQGYYQQPQQYYQPRGYYQ